MAVKKKTTKRKTTAKAKKTTTTRKKTVAKKAKAPARKTTKKAAATKKKAASVKKARATTKRKTAVKKTVKKATVKKTIKFPTKSITQKQTKAQIFQELSDLTGVSKNELKTVFLALRNVVERTVKGFGQFTVPELGIKIRRVVRKATKARKGRNPFTGEEIMIPKKPSRKVVRATVLKSLKEVV